MSEQAYHQATLLLRQSKRAVALTGAGHSTPSGIPDFRSPGTGLWSQVDPMEVASINSFLRNPDRFYEWFANIALQMATAEPNAAHHALAEMEKRGVLRAVVTQNIDGLHQAAGSRHVLELHGNSSTSTCLRCGESAESKPLMEHFIQNHEVPHCSCGGLMKLDVVLFGEMLPLDALQQAQAMVAQCDLLLIAGSSLTVAPASQLPWLAIQAGAPIVICNYGTTWADPYASAVIREDVAKSLPALLEGWE